MGSLLDSKTLGLNVLELQFVMLANHDQNVLVLFRLAQSIFFLCKVRNRVTAEFIVQFCLARSIKSHADCFFYRIFQLNPSLFDM